MYSLKIIPQKSMGLYILVFLVHAFAECVWNTCFKFRPFIGPRMQTFLTSFLAKRVKLEYIRTILQLSDGQNVGIDWVATKDTDTKPWIILCHGLGGDFFSPATRYVTGQLKEAGFRVVIYNRRGHGGVKSNRMPRHVEPEDLKQVVEFIHRVLHVSSSKLNQPINKLFIVGLSAGGNDVAKYLGTFPVHAQMYIDCAFIISTMLNMTDNLVERVRARGGWYMPGVYADFVRNMLRENTHLSNVSNVSNVSNDKIHYVYADISDITEIDKISAELYDHKSTKSMSALEAYYHSTSSHYLLDSIKVPLHMIAAYDDPFLSHDNLDFCEKHCKKKRCGKMLEHGGHVGPMIVAELIDELETKSLIETNNITSR